MVYALALCTLENMLKIETYVGRKLDLLDESNDDYAAAVNDDHVDR